MIKDENGTNVLWGKNKSLKIRDKRRALWVSHAIADLPVGSKILEIGPGFGYLTEILIARQFFVTAIEKSPNLCEGLKERLGTLNLHIIDKNYFDTDFPDSEIFDAIVGIGILHHLWSNDKWVAMISRRLKKNGRIVFLEPNPENKIARFIFNTRLGRFLFSLDPKESLKETTDIYDSLNASFYHISITPADLMYPLVWNLSDKFYDSLENRLPKKILKIFGQSILIFGQKK